MSEEDGVSLVDIKHCVQCGSRVIDENATVTCENVPCHFKLTDGEECESQLSAYAENGSIKFCYSCGSEMESDDNFLFCCSCSDSIKFNVCKKELIISACEVKHCVLCAAAVKTLPNGKIYCSRERCKFRTVDVNITNSLKEYSSKGKIKFCYACGSNTSDDGDYNICSNEDCSSARLPPSSCEVKGTTSDSRNPIVPNATKLTPSAKPTTIISDSMKSDLLRAPNACNVNTETNQIQVVTTSTPCVENQLAQSSARMVGAKVPSKGKETESSGKGNRKKESKNNNASTENNNDSQQEGSSVLSILAKPWKVAVRAVVNALTAKKARPVYQMVLIGETGSGKTSLFNLLCNFDSVCELGLEDGLDLLHNFHDIDLENTQERAMESKTSDAKCYKVRFDELEVGIIDTPGFGDSRGMEEDKKNVKRIIDTIERAEYVNCICLVINGRQARATYQLKYVLTEISATLPKTAFNNLIIIMTNSQDVTCANFDLKELSVFFGSEVTIKPERVFYIDNPYSKLEKCRKEKKLTTHQQLVDALRIAFQIAGETLVKMLQTIKDFDEVHTNCFVQLYNVKQQVESKMLGVLVAHQNRIALEKQIALQKQKLDAAVTTKTLNKEFTTTFKVKKVVVVATTHHNTICGAPNCNSNCHVPCSLSKTVDKENLKGCGCIDRSNNYTCTVCKHSYKDHFHSESVFEIQEEENIFTDEERKKKFEDANSQEELCVKLNAEYDAKLKQDEESMNDLKVALITTVETFQNLGSSPSYEKLLECQVYMLDQRIKAQQSGDDLQILSATKKDLEDKLSIVQVAKKDVSAEGKAAKLKWARSVLKVGPSSTTEEIKQAYKALKRIMHPDKAGGTEANFQDLQQAYEILMN